MSIAIATIQSTIILTTPVIARAPMVVREYSDVNVLSMVIISSLSWEGISIPSLLGVWGVEEDMGLGICITRNKDN